MTRFIALGYAVLALENREGCYSLTKGWEDGPAGLSLTQLYTDALTAAHLAGTLPGIDSTRMLAWGEGLGGGLAIVTSAMTIRPTTRRRHCSGRSATWTFAGLPRFCAGSCCSVQG